MNKLVILLAAMLCFSQIVMADNQPEIKLKKKFVTVPTRSPLYFDVEVYDAGGDLQIIFRGQLPDAVLTIWDKDGNVILHECTIDIYDGMPLIVEDVHHYPYQLEIVSPVLEITGEIIWDSTPIL